VGASELLRKLPGAVNQEIAAGQQFTVQFNISTPSYMTMADGVVAINEGTNEEADVALTLSDENLVELMTGQMSGVTAYMMGKLQVEGDLMLAKDLASYFDTAKLV
jgi:putative sterol carrier protein